MNKKKVSLTRIATEDEKVAKVFASHKDDIALLISTLKDSGAASQSASESILDTKSKETELLVQALKDVVVGSNKEDTLSPQILLQTVKQLDVLEKSIFGMIAGIQASNKEVAQVIAESNLKLIESIEKTRKTDFKMQINRVGGTINEILIKADV